MNSIQMLAILRKGADVSYIPVLSLALSLVTSSFLSADISFAWDWDAANRRKAPDFYGYLSSHIRPLVLSLTLMFWMSFFNLAIRTFFCILLYMKGGVALMYGVLALELAAYLLVKAARKDMWYWIPLYGVQGMIESVSARILIKIVTDWTACVQFRHPNEVGGYYFTINVLVNVLIGIASAMWRAKFDASVSHDTAVLIMSALCIGLVLSYTCFVLSINNEYRHTFYDTQTSCAFIEKNFRSSTADEFKFRVLSSNENKWRENYGQEVKAWVNSNLSIWLKDKPEWFTDSEKVSGG